MQNVCFFYCFGCSARQCGIELAESREAGLSQKRVTGPERPVGGSTSFVRLSARVSVRAAYPSERKAVARQRICGVASGMPMLGVLGQLFMRVCPSEAPCLRSGFHGGGAVSPCRLVLSLLYRRRNVYGSGRILRGAMSPMVLMSPTAMPPRIAFYENSNLIQDLFDRLDPVDPQEFIFRPW